VTCRALDKITWPITQEMIEAINDNFQRLFADLASGALVVTFDMTSGIFPLTVANGGTYITSYTVGDLIYASGATTLSKLADVTAGKYLRSGGLATAPLWSTLTLPNAAVKGDILIATDTNTIGSVVDVAVYRTLHSGGVGAIPAWSLVDLATDCTGALDATQGGTEQTAVAVGDLLYGSALNAWSRLSAGLAGRYLRGAGAATAPEWSTLVLPNVMTTGDLFVATTTNTGGSITAVAAGKLLRSAGTSTVPAYSTFTIPDTFAKGDIPTATAANVLGVIAPSTAGHVLTSNGATLAASFQAVPAVAHVVLSDTHTDTLADTVIRGDVLYGNATPKWARLAFAANSLLGSNATDVLWLTDIPTAVTIGGAYVYRASGTDVPVADGGTGASTFTAYSVICAGTTATGAFQNVVGVGNVGEVLTSAGAAALPAWAALGAWVAHDVLSATHGDTLVDSVLDGDVLIGNVTPKWSRLAISVPAAGLINHLAVANGETRPSWKALFDATVPTTNAPSDAAGVGTAVVAARRDHQHANPATWPATAHALLDGSVHSDSVADDVSRGSLIYGNSTPKWAELVVGAANSVLTSNGTDVAWSVTPTITGLTTTAVAAHTTAAESWVGPSSTAGIYFKGGLVGIGTVNPLILLHLEAATAQLYLVSSTGTNKVGTLYNNTGGNVYVGAERSVGAGYFTGSSAYAAVFGHSGAYPTQLATNGAVRVTIDSAGFVGMNIVAPQALLDLSQTSVGGAVTDLIMRNTDATSGAGATFYFLVGTGAPANANGLGLYRAQATAVGTLKSDLIYYNNTGDALTEQLRLVGATSLIKFTQYGAGTLTTDAAGLITAVSDERLKDIQGPFGAGLAELLCVVPILYKHTKESGLDTINTYAGFSAQNVMRYIPQAVGKDLRGWYTFNDRPVLAAVVNAIKTLQGEIDELRACAKFPMWDRTIVTILDETGIISSARAR